VLQPQPLAGGPNGGRVADLGCDFNDVHHVTGQQPSGTVLQQQVDYRM
jgi:hypothetical protein